MKNESVKEFVPIYCERDDCRYLLGSTNSDIILIGDMQIEQPQVNLVCPKCCQITKRRLTTTVKRITFISDDKDLSGGDISQK